MKQQTQKLKEVSITYTITKMSEMSRYKPQ